MGTEAEQTSPERSLIWRWLRFLAGMSLIALGVALSIRAGLGATPISTIPTVLAEVTPVTVGTYLMALNVFFVVLQILLLRRRFPPFQLVQLPLAILFGLLCDAALWATRWINPGHYAEQVLWTVLSILVLALGVYIEVVARVAYLPGDGIVFTLHQLIRMRFGTVKQLFDWTLVLLAIALSLILLGELFGAREGTALSAIGVGAVVKVIERLHSRWLLRRRQAPGRA
ncbi:hypothetical protein F7P69_29475 [Cellulosimicrobium funkei]|nr:hypothetical protein [Cellulosimicrobium funkei]